MPAYLVGFQFWKANARKFYAIPDKDRQQSSRGQKKRQRMSDSTFETSTIQGESEDVSHLKQLKDMMTAIKASNDTILQLTKDSKVPLGLKKLLTDALKCHICQAVPFKPSIVMTKCCKSILGCESCVNNWYSGPDALTKTCPRCRAERGFCETMRVLGLDELAAGVKSILGDD